MTMLHAANLPAEYRRKLCARELTQETIAGLAAAVSDRYLLRKRAFKRAALILLTVTVLMAALTFFAPNAGGGSAPVILWSYAVTLLAEIPILAAVYVLAVSREPRQFARCLKKGYPDLVIAYGYEQLTDGSLADRDGPRQRSFSMLIADVFPLQGSEDIVVAGFAHGLIERGNSVLVGTEGETSEKPPFAIVTAIEKAGSQTVQAADCKAALRLQKGAALGLAPGMCLYRN